MNAIHGPHLQCASYIIYIQTYFIDSFLLFWLQFVTFSIVSPCIDKYKKKRKKKKGQQEKRQGKKRKKEPF